MMLHLLSLHPNSLSLSSGTKPGCRGEEIDDFDSSTDKSESALAFAIERRTSHALKPIPLSHSFYSVTVSRPHQHPALQEPQIHTSLQVKFRHLIKVKRDRFFDLHQRSPSRHVSKSVIEQAESTCDRLLFQTLVGGGGNSGSGRSISSLLWRRYRYSYRK